MQIVWSVSLDTSGYSSSGRDYILALNSIGQDVKHDKTFVSANLEGYGLTPSENKIFEILRTKPYDKNFVRIHHCVPDKFYIDPKALLNIGYTVAESEQIPERWIGNCNKMDAIFTASSFCKKVFYDNGVTKPIFVIPHCHDTSVWNPNVSPFFMKNNSFKNRFLFAGDITDRKGLNELLSVWKKIPINSDCSLTIKGYYNSFNKKDQDILKESIRDKIKTEVNPIFFYGHCLSNSLIPRFLRSFDYIVSPNKGEGFGLLPFESILLGVPAIVTGSTGNIEYANPNNSILIRTKGFEKASKELLQVNSNFSKSLLVKIDEDHLLQIMEDIILMGNSFSISKEEQNRFLKEYSYNNIGKRIVNTIKTLMK